MKRKDLRTAESDWRATRQPKNWQWEQPKWSLKVTTVLKALAVLLVALVLMDLMGLTP